MKESVKLYLVFVFLFCFGQVSGTGTNEQKLEEKILLSNSQKLPFSSRQSRDTFTISIKGKELLDGKVTFSIKTSSGKIIFRESFPARKLIGYELIEENPTKEQEEEVIKNRIQKFFNKENFSSPAIAADEQYEEDYAENNIWKDIKADRTAVGFFYKIGEEDMRWIAFSKKTNKVVSYRNCC